MGNYTDDLIHFSHILETPLLDYTDFQRRVAPTVRAEATLEAVTPEPPVLVPGDVFQYEGRTYLVVSADRNLSLSDEKRRGTLAVDLRTMGVTWFSYKLTPKTKYPNGKLNVTIR